MYSLNLDCESYLVVDFRKEKFSDLTGIVESDIPSRPVTRAWLKEKLAYLPLDTQLEVLKACILPFFKQA